jgi:TPR repeat protein
MRFVVLALLLTAGNVLAEPADGQIVASIAQCESGTADACLDAATALEQIHAASRLGKTPRALRELANQTWAKQCEGGRGDACLEHGKRLMHAGDKAGAAEIDRGCTLGSGRACLYLAEKEKHPARALALLEQACDLGSAHACEELAGRDHARASELHRKACDGDDPLGCSHAGADRRATDKAGAYGDFLKACDGELFESCVAAGELAPDPANARELFTRACNASVAAGCSGLADLVAHGRGGDRNWGQGLDLAEKACTLSHAARCPQLADLRAHPPDATCSTEESCVKLCDERLGAACRTLGTLVPERWEAFDDGCKYGDAQACLYDGNRYETLADATTMYDRGCKLGDSTACIYVEVAHASVGSAAARESLRRRCAKTPATCTLYSFAIAKREPARAERLWTDACTNGDGAACRLAANEMNPPHYGGATCDCDFPKEKTKAELAEEARAQRRVEESERLLKRACELHDARSSCPEQDDQTVPPRPPTSPAWL